jgi:hypothetical protein
MNHTRSLQLWTELLEKNPASSANRGELAHLVTDMWVAFYLTRDGVVVKEDIVEQPGVFQQAPLRSTSSAFVQAAKEHNMPQLLELLPEPPGGALECPSCRGSRFVTHEGDSHLCFICGGAGWTTQANLDDCIAQGYTQDFWHLHPLHVLPSSS